MTDPYEPRPRHQARDVQTIEFYALLRLVTFHADFSTLLALRGVCAAAQEAADAVLFGHIVVVPWGEFDCAGGRLGGDGIVMLCALRTPGGATLPCKPFTPVPIFPPGVVTPGPQSWRRRLHHTRVLDVLVTTTYDTYAPIVAAARPRVLRRLRASGIWHLPLTYTHHPSIERRRATKKPALTVVDVMLLAPDDHTTPAHLKALTLVHVAPKHLVNVLVTTAYRGTGFPVVGGDTGAAAGVLLFRPLAEGCPLYAYASGGTETARKRLSGSSGSSSFTGLAAPAAPTLLHSLAHTLLSGAYASLTLVGVHELPATLLGLRRPLTATVLHARIVNLVREACHASAAAGFPPRTPAADLAERLRIISRAEYAAEVGHETFKLETWGEMPRWWERPL